MSDETTTETTASTASKSREISMQDGRKVTFGEKTKIKKEHFVEGANVICRIDFEDGRTVKVEIDPASETGLIACGHGLSQKLGDAAAGAENLDDAYESVLEVASRVAKGEWKKASEPGTGGSAKGASELLLAMVAFMTKKTGKEVTKDQVREMLLAMKAGDKAALRRVPAIADEIAAIKAAKKPSKAEADAAQAAQALLDNMAGALAT